MILSQSDYLDDLDQEYEMFSEMYNLEGETQDPVISEPDEEEFIGDDDDDLDDEDDEDFDDEDEFEDDEEEDED